MISAVELYRWMKTHKTLITTARITQIYRTGKSELWFALHTKEKKKFLLIAPPEIIAITEEKKGEHKETGFGRWMRDNIKGAIIEQINQVRSERILQCDLRKGPLVFTLFIELFGQGNIIVCQNEKILTCLIKTSQIEKGGVYNPSKKFDSFHATEAEAKEHLKTIEPMTVSKLLATEFGLGGQFAAQVCAILAIDVHAPKEALYDVDITSAIQKVLEMQQDTTPSEYFSKKEKKIENKKLKKIQTIIEQQEKQKKQVTKSIEELTAAGEFIYNNYGFFAEAGKEYSKDTLDLKTLKEKHNVTTTCVFKKPHIEIEM